MPLLPTNRLRRRLLLAGALLALLLILGFGFLRRSVLRIYVLNSHGPTPAAMTWLARTCEDQEAAVRLLWETRRLQQRYHALETVARRMPYEQLRPFLLDAIADPDGDLAMLGLQLLSSGRDPDNLAIYQALMHDPNPKLRWRACIALAAAGDPSYIPVMAPHLADADAKVRMAAMGALQRWTGHDDGVHSQSPEAAIQQASRRWQSWAAARPPVADDAVAVEPTRWHAPLPAPPLKLEDRHEESFRLRDWRGQAVVLVFWSEGEAWSLHQLENVLATAEQLADGVQVVAVNVDRVPTIYVNHAAEETIAAAADFVTLPPSLAWPFLQVAADIATISAYRVQETPVTVMIDAQGRLHRRLTGIYPAESLVAMAADLYPIAR